MIRVFSRPTTLGLALVTLITLVGCGSDDDDDETGGTVGDVPGLIDGDSEPGAVSSPSPTNDAVPETAVVEPFGTIYVDRDSGHSLYLRPSDPPNEVTCLEACAEVFPPLLTEFDFMGISDPFDVLARPDGENQWIYAGYPLHRHAGDGAPGEANGQGLDDAWYLARPIPVSSADTSIGEVLAVSGTTVTASGVPSERSDFDGYTLYTFEDDRDGVIACDGECLDVWSPLYADIGAQPGGRYTLVARDDGNRQRTYLGAPLYVYSGDSGPAQLNGAEVDGWSAVTQ